MKLLLILAVALGAGCALPGYRAWKQDPIGSQARENASYWHGWRVGYAEGIYATKETREEYRAKQAASDAESVTRCGSGS